MWVGWSLKFLVWIKYCFEIEKKRVEKYNSKYLLKLNFVICVLGSYLKNLYVEYILSGNCIWCRFDYEFKRILWRMF